MLSARRVGLGSKLTFCKSLGLPRLTYGAAESSEVQGAPGDLPSEADDGPPQRPRWPPPPLSCWPAPARPAWRGHMKRHNVIHSACLGLSGQQTQAVTAREGFGARVGCMVQVRCSLLAWPFPSPTRGRCVPNPGFLHAAVSSPVLWHICHPAVQGAGHMPPSSTRELGALSRSPYLTLPPSCPRNRAAAAASLCHSVRQP